jgi:hypothetical protein
MGTRASIVPANSHYFREFPTMFPWLTHPLQAIPNLQKVYFEFWMIAYVFVICV